MGKCEKAGYLIIGVKDLKVLISNVVFPIFFMKLVLISIMDAFACWHSNFLAHDVPQNCKDLSHQLTSIQNSEVCHDHAHPTKDVLASFGPMLVRVERNVWVIYTDISQKLVWTSTWREQNNSCLSLGCPVCRRKIPCKIGFLLFFFSFAFLLFPAKPVLSSSQPAFMPIVFLFFLLSPPQATHTTETYPFNPFLSRG